MTVTWLWKFAVSNFDIQKVIEGNLGIRNIFYLKWSVSNKAILLIFYWLWRKEFQLNKSHILSDEFFDFFESDDSNTTTLCILVMSFSI